MNYITYFIKFFYRIRYWLIFVPILIALLVFWKTKHMPHNYTSNCSIYTGIITGVNILSESGITTTSYSQGSMMENILNIITADNTLKQVSLRLYARIMVYGDPERDNEYINADHYRQLYDHGTKIHHLIDKSSPNDSINEQRTYENLIAYETNNPENYVYGIYQWNLPYVNRASLQKIIVERIKSSDVIELSYTTDDPGITYQTLRILIDEFIKQYQELRFGETNNVIAYFRAELKRIGAELTSSEDDLTAYRVKNKVINYGKETEYVAAINRDYDNKYWESKSNYEVSDSLLQVLEKRMSSNIAIIRNNTDFISYTNKIGTLEEKLAVANLYPESKIPQVTLDSLREELRQSQLALENILKQQGTLSFGKEGISNSSIIMEWLAQTLANKKAEAELKVLNNQKMHIAQKYVHFAPIGSTLNRKEREVTINESRYMTTLNALNAALLRQKSLQMTSATLKVMNEPYYPLAATVISNKKLVLGAFLGSLIFTIFFFLIIEILDHTLKYVFKAEQLTGCRVLGSFTNASNLRSRRYNQMYINLSACNLANYAATYFKPNQNNIINLISNEPGEGKSFVMQQLSQQFTEQGLDVKELSWQSEQETDIQNFIQSLNLNIPEANAPRTQKEKVILVEYPSLKKASLTSNILQGVSLNLQIVDSRRTWKNTDQQLLNRTKEMCADTPLFLVLNYVQRDTAEEINGLMPPYSFFRKLFYRLSQLGLTARDKHHV